MNTHKLLKVLLVSGLLATVSPATLAGGYYHFKHHGHGHGDGAALAAGLIIGGLFGYLISEDRHRYYRSYDYRSYDYSSYGYRDYRSHYHPRSTVVYERVEQMPTVITTERDTEFAGHDCVMTREYTTTINIDGVDKQAYGTRCMTADGGWVLGRPKLVPEH